MDFLEPKLNLEGTTTILHLLLLTSLQLFACWECNDNDDEWGGTGKYFEEFAFIIYPFRSQWQANLFHKLGFGKCKTRNFFDEDNGLLYLSLEIYWSLKQNAICESQKKILWEHKVEVECQICPIELDTIHQCFKK